jgi:hypothetical protein
VSPLLTEDLRRHSGLLRALGILLLVFAAFYAVKLATPSLAIDDELAVFRDKADYWVGQGRWTTYLVERFLLPQPVLPFLPTALFGLLLSVAYVMLLRAARIGLDRIEAYVAFPLFCAFPTWFFLVEFQANTVPAAVGVLAASATAALFAHVFDLRDSRQPVQALLRWIAALACGAVALGVYQANAMLLAVLGLALIALKALADDERAARTVLADMLVLAATVVGALLLYAAILAAFRATMRIAPEYIDSFVRPDLLVAQPTDVLQRTYRTLWRVYTGSHHVYGAYAFAYGPIVLTGFAAIAFTPQLAGRPGVRALLLATLVAMVLAPFAIHPISNGWLPFRTLVGVPAVMWFCALAALTVPLRWLPRVALAVVAIALLQTLYVGNLMRGAAALVRQHDALVGAAVYARIAEVQPGFDRSRPYRIAFHGSLPFRSPYPYIDTATAGASFFEWDHGNTGRIVAYMHLLGFDNLVMSPQPERDALAERFAGMPLWPARGSVAVEGDVILVRLGP